MHCKPQTKLNPNSLGLYMEKGKRGKKNREHMVYEDMSRLEM
jgi:hypothetical protein